MKFYRNEARGFELQIPDEWSLHTESKVGQNEYSLVFKCRPKEACNIQIGPVLPEPSLAETERHFHAYIEEAGYTSPSFGRFVTCGREQLWARYYVGGGMWSKKYLIVFEGLEYDITVTCLDQNLLLDLEKSWDRIAFTFQSLSACAFDLNRAMQILARPATLAEMPQRVELSRQALEHIDRHQNPEDWAAMQLELAKNLAQNPQGDRVQKIEEAILHNKNALEVFTRERYSEFWANIKINLGSNYRNRLTGDQAENIEEAIRQCQQALEVLTIYASPLLWANAHNNLANSFRDRIQGDRADNIEQCIHHCHEALSVFTRGRLPRQWATVQNNLGNAYQDRLRGKLEANVEEALACYQQALQVFTPDRYPEDCAWTQSNLGAAYNKRVRGKQNENIELSIQYSTRALQVFNKTSHPEKWALTHLNLGNSYLHRQTGKQDENRKQALEHYQEALSILTQQTHPEHWDKIQAGVSFIKEITPSTPTTKAPAPCPDPSPKLTYSVLYEAAFRQSPDEKRNIQLIYADVPNIQFATNMLLIYQWEGELSTEEADRLRLRAAVYLSSAICDVGKLASVPCQLSPIPNGQRPAWFIPRESAPISVTLSEADTSDHTLQISIGPIVIAMDRFPTDKTSLKKLMQGFKKKYTRITL